MIAGEVIEHKTEVAVDTASGAVGEQQRGAAALHDDIEAGNGKCLFGGHADDAEL
ncbi:hypothetical protein [Streptomyces sp. B1I3]|uniref:hypothetical protein n=1 Tax=Streptomyces sp. B1I3 TaxID=3042264 RepID=UPI002780911A|nr:hypothetical protein [Streptomyces sp. B1I3]MDQ0792158.1 hypothetical protein [Streptomyces sp. B1I3]